MSYQKYLQTISQIGTGKIFVENVRQFMNTNVKEARLLCEMAVQNKIFIRKIGLVCPNDNRIIREYDSTGEIPEIITCKVCEIDGIEPDTFRSDELRKITYYTLK